MNYLLKIVKTEPNPNYKEQLAEYNSHPYHIGARNEEMPREETVKNVLICEVTEEQFKKIKAETFKVFE